jgi:hypothetical protein
MSNALSSNEFLVKGIVPIVAASIRMITHQPTSVTVAGTQSKLMYASKIDIREQKAVEADHVCFLRPSRERTSLGKLSPSETALMGSILSLIHESRRNRLGVSQKYRSGSPSLEPR